jgi:hypothetical protein
MAKPFYGIDGNLLVEDLPYNHDDVEAILNGMLGIVLQQGGEIYLALVLCP